MRSPQRKRLTPKQKALVKAVVIDPNASLSELGETSGYSSAQHVHRALQAPAVVDYLAQCRDLMDKREKLTIGALLTHLEEGLEATEIRSLKVDGEKMTVSAEVKDFAVRHKFLTSALKLRGLEGADKDDAPTGPMNVALVLLGGGSDAEKTAVVDLLIAARLSRGLHPIENRKMTAEEAASYRRTA